MDPYEDSICTEKKYNGNDKPQGPEIVDDHQPDAQVAIDMPIEPANNEAEAQFTANENSEPNASPEPLSPSADAFWNAYNAALDPALQNCLDLIPPGVEFSPEAQDALASAVSSTMPSLWPEFTALLGSFPIDWAQSLGAEYAAHAVIQHTNNRHHSLASILRFIHTLPEIPMADLEDGGECGICRGAYGENVSMDAGKTEKPVRLPCNHVFGHLCLQILLSPKSEGGWEVRTCPLCRKEIKGIEEVEEV